MAALATKREKEREKEREKDREKFEQGQDKFVHLATERERERERASQGLVNSARKTGRGRKTFASKARTNSGYAGPQNH